MDQVKPKYFTTSFGRIIKVFDGYYELHNPLNSNPLKEKGNLFQYAKNILIKEGFSEFIKRIIQKLPGMEVPPWDYTKDVFMYSMMIDFLMRRGVDCSWENSLDMGGAEGFISRLLKAEGFSKRATCVDINDLRQKGALIYKHQRNFRTQLWMRNLKSLLGRQPLNHGYTPPKGHKFWNIRFSNSPEIDAYIVGDFLDVQGSFDFISGLNIIQFFSLEELFAKLSSLLRPGGILYFLVDYWWWPVNSTTICGYFPYACQRLTANDFERYVREFHASEVEDILTRYYYYHRGKQRPTVSDYLDYGWRAGFEPIGYERLMPSEKPHPKTPLPPKALEQFKEFSMEDVLADIHCFKPDVRLEDLFTAFAIFALTKRERATKSFCVTKSLR